MEWKPLGFLQSEQQVRFQDRGKGKMFIYLLMYKFTISPHNGGCLEMPYLLCSSFMIECVITYSIAQCSGNYVKFISSITVLSIYRFHLHRLCLWSQDHIFVCSAVTGFSLPCSWVWFSCVPLVLHLLSHERTQHVHFESGVTECWIDEKRVHTVSRAVTKGLRFTPTN